MISVWLLRLTPSGAGRPFSAAAASSLKASRAATLLSGPNAVTKRAISLGFPLRSGSKGQPKVKPGADDFRRLMALAAPERLRLAAAIGLLVISSSVTMAVPFALGKVIDIIYSMDQKKHVGGGDGGSEKELTRTNLNQVCAALVAVFAVGGLANFGRVYLMRTAAQGIAARLRSSVFASIVRQEVAFFDSSRNRTGELVNRLSADTQLVSGAISQQISDGLRSTFMTAAGAGMMFYMSPQLALVSLGVVPPVAAWGVLMGRRVRAASRKVQDSLAQATQTAEERIANIRTVRSFAAEARETAAYDADMVNVLDNSRQEAMVHAQFYGMTGLSGNMIILTVLYYGGSLVTLDVITVGNLTSFILYAAYVGIGFSGISTFYAEMMKALGSSSRLWEITDRTPTIPLSGGKVPSSSLAVASSGEVAFRGITFSYPERKDVRILRDLNLVVKPGQVVAVVGESGSGKSTLGSLLLRLYDPDSGQITVDSHDIKDLDPQWLRSRIGTVPQEPVLFSCSIRENIAYGALDPSAVTPEQVEAAAREANAHEFISGFPDGYETLVGERGVMLSGGQKQRVAIARAILRNPHILILDEATSALDGASEHQVQVALDRVMKDRSVIIIAHRLSTIQNADLIAVLRAGRVCEQGTFPELMALENGHFKALLRK